MNIQHVGHIKIGGTVRGEPAIFKKIKLTNLYKENGDNFIVYENTRKDGYDKLMVSFPFVSFLDLNFNVREMSFVKINDFYKYIAFIHNNEVYLEPYQPDFQNPIEDLPSIKLGSVEKWGKNLDIDTKAIAYFNVYDEEGNELGIFDFKTRSAHTIQSFMKNLELMKKIPTRIFSAMKFEIRIIKKIFETEKNSEIAYLDLIMPSFVKMMEVKKTELYELISEEDLEFVLEMEKEIKKEQKDIIEKAISVEEAKKFFANKFVVSIDTKETFEFAHLKQLTPPKGKEISFEKKEEEVEEIGFVEQGESVKEASSKKKEVSGKKTNREILREYKDIIVRLRKKGLDLVFARKLVLTYLDKAFEIAEENNFDKKILEKIIK